MRISIRLLIGAVALLSFTFPHRLYSQAVYGGIVGTVTDPHDASIAGAKVTVRDLDRDVTFTTETNVAGNYSLGHLIVGRYQVRVEAPGFQLQFANAGSRDAERRPELHRVGKPHGVVPAGG